MKREKQKRNSKKKIKIRTTLFIKKLNILFLFSLLACASNKIEVRGNAVECFPNRQIAQIKESYFKEFGIEARSLLVVKSEYFLEGCNGLMYFSTNLKSSNVFHKILFFNSKLFINYKNDDWTDENIEGLEMFLESNKNTFSESQINGIKMDFLKGTDPQGVGR